MYTLRIQIFQKRTPAQEQTNKELQEQPTWCISIHRLLAEPDEKYINDFILYIISIHRFLAEPDANTPFNTFGVLISIHRLLAEPDNKLILLISCAIYFNPQAPRGARQ